MTGWARVFLVTLQKYGFCNARASSGAMRRSLSISVRLFESAGSPPERRGSTALSRYVVFELLDDEFLLGDDVFHQISNRDNAN